MGLLAVGGEPEPKIEFIFLSFQKILNIYQWNNIKQDYWRGNTGKLNIKSETSPESLKRNMGSCGYNCV